MNTEQPEPSEDGRGRLMGVAEVAKRLHVGRNFVYNRMNDGSLGFVELRGGKRKRRRVTEEQLQAYIAGGGDTPAETVTPTA